jgi:hydroxymethylpyrimidine/phosphomethylpyrimidine kinase
VQLCGRILVVAGSDSGGGAGIQADSKTATAFGVYAATAVTALTAQNTRGVSGIVAVDPAFVALQMQVVLEDIGADAIKIGMLLSAPVIRAVSRMCARYATNIPIVVDPVMTAKDGHSLLDADARAVLAAELIPRAALVTPNTVEAQVLTGRRIDGIDDMLRACDDLLEAGAGAVLLKGGHLPGDRVTDVLRTADGAEHRFESERILTRSTHGTGCTLATAIACGIAEGLTLHGAVERAHAYVVEAIRSAPGLGSGAGPLNHVHAMEPSTSSGGPSPPARDRRASARQ